MSEFKRAFNERVMSNLLTPKLIWPNQKKQKNYNCDALEINILLIGKIVRERISESITTFALPHSKFEIYFLKSTDMSLKNKKKRKWRFSKLSLVYVGCWGRLGMKHRSMLLLLKYNFTGFIILFKCYTFLRVT